MCSVPTLFLPGIWLDVPVSSSSQSSIVWCWASRSRPRSPVPSSRAANSGHSSTWAQGRCFLRLAFIVRTNYDIHHTGSFSKVVLSQGAVNKVFLGLFHLFLDFFHSKIWAQFHFGTFEPCE